MKRKAIYHIKRISLALLAIVGLSACSSDLGEEPFAPTQGDKVQVTINIGVQEPNASTRAWDDTQEKGTDGENMYSWIVVIAGEEGKIKKVFKKDNVTDLSDDVVAESFELEAGTYDFYSFANISESSLGTLSEESFEKEAFTVNGNGFNVAENHIPMSNKQTITISGSDQTVELWVVRMLAKIELQLTNETGSDITINSVTLSEITSNGKNFMLLPNPINEGETGACKPNLIERPVTEDYEYSSEVSINNGETKNLTFYVNESAKPTKNPHGLFTLSLETKSGTMRYALITNEDNNWDYIARNDYRIIPVTLQDYKLDIIPYDFPPIGVLPASVKEEAGLFTVTFHAAGHFHLVPKVTKYSDGKEVPYGGSNSADIHWQYSSWDAVGTVPPGFYVTADAPIADGSENGGTPVWVESSQCVIGNLAEGEDAEAFHDLTIGIYNGSSAAAIRQLTYHLCIVKDIAY